MHGLCDVGLERVHHTLVYRILSRIEANELDWYLFYTYAPAVFIGFAIAFAFQIARALK